MLKKFSVKSNPANLDQSVTLGGHKSWAEEAQKHKASNCGVSAVRESLLYDFAHETANLPEGSGTSVSLFFKVNFNTKKAYFGHIAKDFLISSKNLFDTSRTFLVFFAKSSPGVVFVVSNY